MSATSSSNAPYDEGANAGAGAPTGQSSDTGAGAEPAGVDPGLVFSLMPSACAVLDRSLVITDCNAAYQTVTGRRRASLVGRRLFEAFPPAGPGAAAAVRRVLEDAVRTGRTVVLRAQRYDISPTGDPADLQERYWSTTAVPLRAGTGPVQGLLYNVHDVTALATAGASAAGQGNTRLGELFQAAVQVTEQFGLFDEVAVAERQLGLAVQDAMLPAEIPVQLRDRVAVRYLPGWDRLQVGGDWYDVTHLDDDRFAVAVGDVVGHGLGAAVLMGKLRAALSALTRAELGPATALSCLDDFARGDEAAVATTVVKLVLDLDQHTITYSSAGHPPAILLEADGRIKLLTQAQGAALALRGGPAARPTATVRYGPGARLVLFTDGLVERHDRDLDTGISQLIAWLTRNAHRSLEDLAELLLEKAAVDQTDDIALLLVQL